MNGRELGKGNPRNNFAPEARPHQLNEGERKELEATILSDTEISRLRGVTAGAEGLGRSGAIRRLNRRPGQTRLTDDERRELEATILTDRQIAELERVVGGANNQQRRGASARDYPSNIPPGSTRSVPSGQDPQRAYQNVKPNGERLTVSHKKDDRTGWSATPHRDPLPGAAEFKAAATKNWVKEPPSPHKINYRTGWTATPLGDTLPGAAEFKAAATKNLLGKEKPSSHKINYRTGWSATPLGDPQPGAAEFKAAATKNLLGKEQPSPRGASNTGMQKDSRSGSQLDIRPPRGREDAWGR